MVTSAIFAPHPDLIVPQEAGTEKVDSDCKSDSTDDSETIPSGTDYNYGNCEIVKSQQYTVWGNSEQKQPIPFSLFFSSGALKTDHSEVLLSADFTGAIKVFVNVKKYWVIVLNMTPSKII